MTMNDNFVPVSLIPNAEEFAVKENKVIQKAQVIYKNPAEFKSIRFKGQVISGPDQYGKYTLMATAQGNPITPQLNNFINNLANVEDYDQVTVPWDNEGSIKFKPGRSLKNYKFTQEEIISGTMEFMFYFNQKERKCGCTAVMITVTGFAPSKILYSV